MSTSEDIRMLSETVLAARKMQEIRMEEVRRETQKEIDKYEDRLTTQTLDAVKRYLQFKKDLRTTGEHLGFDIMSNLEDANPEKFVLESVYEPQNKVVFKQASDDYSSFYFSVPLEYFDNPEAWEKKFNAWVADIHAMVSKAPSIFNADCEYHATTIALPYPGDYFYLRERKPGAKTTLSLVEYHTGNVYQGSKLESIENGEAVPIACLK